MKRALLGLVGLLLVLALVLLIFGERLVDRVGGAFRGEPEQLETGLSSGARELVERAFAGLRGEALADYHVHAVGLGAGGSGIWINPMMRSWWHPLRRLRFSVYVSAAGVTDLARADEQYIERLVRLVRGIKGHGRYHLLAFDRHYNRDGTVNAHKTEFFVPNAYVMAVARRYPRIFVPTISIHPYRPDAVESLRKWAGRGARLLKWLPNAMGIDPSLRRNDPFYREMQRLGVALITHAGEEKAVEADEDQRFGNPLLLRRPLDLGVKVIVAHCASLGDNVDLDDPKRRRRDNFDLFLRLMGERKYEGLLFGEISAMTQFNRIGRPLMTVLERPDLQRRLVNGSDYPLPAINVIVRTGKLVDAGLITRTQRELLNEIYNYNPLLFDFVVKRTLRHPASKKGLSPSVFRVKDGLGAAGR